MSFGWSVGDIVAALEVLNKVRIALKDSGGASSDYLEECAFIQSVSATLQNFGVLRDLPIDQSLSDDLETQSKRIKKSIDDFKRDVLARFGSALGGGSSRGKLLAAPRKVQWALSKSIAKEVRKLHSDVESQLQTMQCTMLLLTIRSVNQMPNAVREQMAHLDQTMRLRSENTRTYETSLSDRQSQTLAQIQATLSNFQIQLQESAASTDQTRKMTIDSLSHLNNTNSKLVERFQMLHIGGTDEDGNPGVLQSTIQSSQVFDKLQDLQSLVEALRVQIKTGPVSSPWCGPPTQSISVTSDLWHVWQALTQLTSTIRVHILGVLILLLPYFMRFYSNISRHFRLLSWYPRLLASHSSGFIFEDALGRSTIFPSGSLRSWQTFTQMLNITFEGHPGEQNVKAGFYLIADARRRYQRINSDSWSKSTQPGGHLAMSMVVRSKAITKTTCPKCSSASNPFTHNTNFSCTCSEPAEDDDELEPDPLTSSTLDDLRIAMDNDGSHKSSDEALPATRTFENTDDEIAKFKRAHFWTDSPPEAIILTSQVTGSVELPEVALIMDTKTLRALDRQRWRELMEAYSRDKGRIPNPGNTEFSKLRWSYVSPDARGRDISPEAKWTLMKRSFISAEVLDKVGMRYEARPDFVAIFGVLSKGDLFMLVRRSAELRMRRIYDIKPAKATLTTDSIIVHTSP